ncbi:hypothetical protein EMPS_03875 [Entomortierella parvispora]|uniref:Transcription activator GCR1-like domain-containing protein n=1 Tax=Entomortierella parvispora TaxID=205924 RepID=A0A9P3H7N5_9FUNG|nr:hypothetical protein EMPS_03875 [Entomortierella parvispora]
MTVITTSPRISPNEDVHELDRDLHREARRAALAEEDKGLVYWQEWCDDKGLERIPTREQMVEFTREFVLPMEAALNERIRRDPTKGKPFCGRTVFIEPVLRYRARMQSQTSAQPKSPPVSATRDLATMPTMKIEDVTVTTAEPMASVASSERFKRQASSHILSPTAKRALLSRTSLATDAPEGHSRLRSSTTGVKEEPVSSSLPLSMSSHSLPTPTSPISNGPVTSEQKSKKPQQLQKTRPLGRVLEKKPPSKSSRHTHEEVIKESKLLNSPVSHSPRGSRDQESLQKAGGTLSSLSDIKNSRALQALALQHPTVSSTDSKKDSFPIPIREIVSIPDIWTEWTQGWMGEPSIESLIKTHGP